MKRPLGGRLPNRTLLAMTGSSDAFRDVHPMHTDGTETDRFTFRMPRQGPVVVTRRPISRMGRGSFWGHIQLQLMLAAMSDVGGRWEVWGTDEEEAKTIFVEAQRELSPLLPLLSPFHPTTIA